MLPSSVMDLLGSCRPCLQGPTPSDDAVLNWIGGSKFKLPLLPYFRLQRLIPWFEEAISDEQQHRFHVLTLLRKDEELKKIGGLYTVLFS